MLIPRSFHLGSSKKMLIVYLCVSFSLWKPKGWEGHKSALFKHMVSETLWAPLAPSHMEQQWKEGLGNKQIPAHLPPQAQLPLFVPDGHTSSHCSCSFLFAGSWGLKVLVPCVLNLGCLPLSSFILPHHLEWSPPTQSCQACSSFHYLKWVTHFHSSLCYPEMLLSLYFHYPKELCSLISSSRIQKYYSL